MSRQDKVDDVAHFLGSIGWASPCDAQWTRLADNIQSLKKLVDEAAEYELSPEQIMALKDFARIHGRKWKSKLVTAWSNGTDEKYGGTIRQIRNQFGPEFIIDLKMEDL